MLIIDLIKGSYILGKKLIITEKPSVARDFARVLRVGGNQNGFIENNEYVISWCYGHLVQMVYPEDYDMKYKRWNLEDLPFLPEEYKYGVNKVTNSTSYETVEHKYIPTHYDCLDGHLAFLLEILIHSLPYCFKIRICNLITFFYCDVNRSSHLSRTYLYAVKWPVGC